MNFTFIPTPNGIKATDRLNDLAKKLDNETYIKSYHFEIDFDARWCLQIFFKGKSGWLALKEQRESIQVWIYSYDNDLKPKYYEFPIDAKTSLFNFIKHLAK